LSADCKIVNNPNQLRSDRMPTSSKNTGEGSNLHRSPLSLSGTEFGPFFDPRTAKFVLLLRFFVWDLNGFDMLPSPRACLLRLNSSLFCGFVLLPPRGTDGRESSPISYLTVSIDAEMVTLLIITFQDAVQPTAEFSSLWVV
jgi:hypothetical protein